MKRMLLMTTTSAMLAVAAPGVASAHHGERHHGSHRANAHRHHHHHHAAPARVRIFGTPAAPVSTPPGTPPVTPPSRNDEPAGTVASFAGGVLTITLKDGSTVSGKVTDRTEIHCQSATVPPPVEEGEHGGDRSHGEDGQSSGRDDGDDGPGDDNGAGDDANEHSCTTAALVAGAVVREAKLIVSSSGAIWANVDLVG